MDYVDVTKQMLSFAFVIVIVSAGKPLFYTEVRRPFREVNKETSRVKFKKVRRSSLSPSSIHNADSFSPMNT
jgi:hypothetical protein